jgi:hypothetical protein
VATSPHAPSRDDIIELHRGFFAVKRLHIEGRYPDERLTDGYYLDFFYRTADSESPEPSSEQIRQAEAKLGIVKVSATRSWQRFVARRAMLNARRPASCDYNSRRHYPSPPDDALRTELGRRMFLAEVVAARRCCIAAQTSSPSLSTYLRTRRCSAKAVRVRPPCPR